MASRRSGWIPLLGLAIALGGCATKENPDPWEPMNRGIFAFNETLDKYAIEPVAKGWDFVLPEIVQTGIGNFFDNLNMPIVFANDVLQAKPGAAFFDLMRFLYNSTFGLAGLIDIATMVEIPRNDEDFGQTLGYWGLSSGPYLVLPIFGPSTVRDGTGLLVDSAARSFGYITPFWSGVVGLSGAETTGATIGTTAIELINLRARFLEEIASSRADAFDYYVFVRNAFLQNRRAKVNDQPETSAEDDEDLYFFEDDEFEDDEEDYEDYDDAPDEEETDEP